MKIQNLKLKGEKLLVGNELVQFDADGIAFFDDEVGEGLLALPNFIQIKEDNQAEEKDTEPNVQEEVQEPTQEVEELVEELDEPVMELTPDMYKDLTIKRLKEVLEEKGIAYPKNAKKEELLELLG